MSTIYLQRKLEWAASAPSHLDLPYVAVEIEMSQGSPSADDTPELTPMLCSRAITSETGESSQLGSPGDKIASPSLQGNMSIFCPMDYPAMVNYYTSSRDYQHYIYFFSCLGPAAKELKFWSRKVEPEDDLFLTLMKLRLNKDF